MDSQFTLTIDEISLVIHGNDQELLAVKQTVQEAINLLAYKLAKSPLRQYVEDKQVALEQLLIDQLSMAQLFDSHAPESIAEHMLKQLQGKFVNG